MRNGRSIELSPGLLRRDCRQVARNSHCRPTSLRRVGTTQHQASGSHTPATIDSFTGTVVAALFLPEASHAESHESRQEPASFAGKTRRAACKDCACAAAREDRARAARAAREDRARAAPQTVARSRLARRRSRNGGVLSGPSREIELEPKSPSSQNARLRGRKEKETEGVTLVFMRHSAPQFPLHPYLLACRR
jgi:hypothetical protein